MFVLNGNPGKVLKVLGSCGLTEYESKAYFTLLLTDREKMWELSKKSSVPQSKIYLVMDSLKYKGLVDLSAECPKTSSPRPFEPYEQGDKLQAEGDFQVDRLRESNQ